MEEFETKTAKTYLERHLNQIDESLKVEEWTKISDQAEEITYRDISVVLNTGAVRHYRVYSDGFVDSQ